MRIERKVAGSRITGLAGERLSEADRPMEGASC